jgi:DNA-binding transcriptional regulator GbsR (MarR family)
MENKKIDDLVNDIGGFIEYWGFRKIHGRIWALLYLSENSLSTPEIVQRLGVSKALISGAINELLNHQLIERVGQVKFGGITYEATSSPAEVVRDIVRNRELVLFNKIEESLKDLNQLNIQECSNLGIKKESLKNLKILTGHHKKIAESLCKKNIKTMDEWIGFIKKISRFTF